MFFGLGLDPQARAPEHRGAARRGYRCSSFRVAGSLREDKKMAMMMASPMATSFVDAAEVEIAGQRRVDGFAFPLVLGPANGKSDVKDRAAFVAREREALVGCLRRHGAVVLRGWGGRSESKDFLDVMTALCKEAHGGMACSAGVRLTVVDGGDAASLHSIVTANEAPPCDTIPFHHEMAQCPKPPAYICFFCDRPPTTGGATPLMMSRHVVAYLRATHPDLYARLKDRGVRARARHAARIAK